MARAALGDPLAGLAEGRLERLARIAARRLKGRPVHPGSVLPNTRASNAGLEFTEHRRLMPGDDPRHVDWRASARHRSLLVRRYRDERTGGWTLCLDRSASMGAATGVWTLALTLTAALAYVLLALDHRVGLVLFSTGVDQRLPLGRGRCGYLALRRALSGARPLAGGGDSRLEACLPVISQAGDAVVISDFLRPDGMFGALSQMAARCTTVQVLQIQGEAATLPGDGQLSLEDVESGERLDTVSSPELIRSAAERHKRLTCQLQRHCRQRRIRCTPAAVNGSWECVLLTHLIGSEDGRA